MSVERLCEHAIPADRGGRDIRINRCRSCVINDVHSPGISSRNPRHHGRARTLAHLERTIEGVAVIVRRGKPDHVLVSPGAVHRPHDINVPGRVDRRAWEIVSRIVAISLSSWIWAWSW